MLAILHPNTDENSDDYRTTFQFLEELQGIQLQTHVVQGEQQKLTEIYLVGDTKKQNIEDSTCCRIPDFTTKVLSR